MDDLLETELRKRVEALGYDLVQMERAGSRSRPIIRLRVDKPDGRPGQSVTVDECAQVSRALEPFLDECHQLSDRYLLEVSSPGLERPLIRRRDFERFAGEQVALHGVGLLDGGRRRLRGELVGASEREGQEYIALRLAEGRIVEVPRKDIERAHLVFHWDK